MNPISTRLPTVLVMHHDPLTSAGLVAALRENGGFDVRLDTADCGTAALPSVDVVITDFQKALELARTNGQAMRSDLRSARILVLTTDDREASIRRALQTGVHGYMLAGGSLAEIVDAVAAVANGLRHLGRGVAERMAESLASTALTSRETEVLGLVMRGEANKVIARRLAIEVGTVKAHMSAIMSKLGASSRTHAAGIAAARGLVMS